MSLIPYAGSHGHAMFLAKLAASIEALDAEAKESLPTPAEVEFEPEMISGRPTVRTIIRAVSLHFNVSVVDILSYRRTKRVLVPRQIAIWLARKHTLRSLPAIGKCFGGRDHTTAIHSINKIERLLLPDSALAADVAAIEARIMGEPPNVR